MPALFPRHTIEWKLEEPPLLRRLTYSLPAMAVTTGILVHLFRWFALSRRSTAIWLFLLLFIVSTVLLLGLARAAVRAPGECHRSHRERRTHCRRCGTPRHAARDVE